MLKPFQDLHPPPGSRCSGSGNTAKKRISFLGCFIVSKCGSGYISRFVIQRLNGGKIAKYVFAISCLQKNNFLSVHSLFVAFLGCAKCAKPKQNLSFFFLQNLVKTLSLFHAVSASKRFLRAAIYPE